MTTILMDWETAEMILALVSAVALLFGMWIENKRVNKDHDARLTDMERRIFILEDRMDFVLRFRNDDDDTGAEGDDA